MTRLDEKGYVHKALKLMDMELSPIKIEAVLSLYILFRDKEEVAFKEVIDLEVELKELFR